MFVITRAALISSEAHAFPRKLEVWFLTELPVEATVYLPREGTRYSPLFAQETRKCIPMGEYCFDPQVGLYQNKKDGDFGDAPTIVEDDKEVIPSATSLDRDLIDCKKKENMFDIFCGKAKKAAEAASTEVWIDVSSSMDKVDPSDLNQECFRLSFVRRIRDNCNENEVNFFVYNTSKKQLGDWASLCTNVGLNSAKSMIQWIESSEAKKLVIITDIFELNKEFTDYIELKGAVIKGDNMKKPLDAKNMLDEIPTLAKSCQKK